MSVTLNKQQYWNNDNKLKKQNKTLFIYSTYFLMVSLICNQLPAASLGHLWSISGLLGAADPVANFPDLD